MADQLTDTNTGTLRLGDHSVRRLGFGAMRITGAGVWGEPEDRDEALAVLRRAVELGVNLIDTADSYGPNVSEELIAEALHPYPTTSWSPPRRGSFATARASGAPTAGPSTSARPWRAA